MSSKLGDTGVGELFATTPKRAAGLAGSLAPRPRLAPVPAAPDDDTASAEAGPGPASVAKWNQLRLAIASGGLVRHPARGQVAQRRTKRTHAS